jgi:pimeloyl-ACP methyl ester carboxylesterase
VPILARPDGALLSYEVHGPPAAPVAVLLEGMGGDVAGWRRNIPHLSARYRVLAWDLRGNGASTMPDAPATIATFVDDTVALLDHLGCGRVHVYGQSFGGMIAQELALRAPERVRSLVLAATHAGHAHIVPVPDALRTVPKDRPWEALYAPGFPEAHPDHVADDLRHGTPQDPAAGRRQWEAARTFETYDRLPGITAPTLVLHGDQDRLIDPGNARVLASRIPGARLEILEGAGHVYHSEQADRADAIVLAFLQDVDDV